jgi:serine protease AprX
MAVERAWANGITVVVAASNRGPDGGTISKPADDPFVITVGAVADRSTPGIGDDSVPSFSAAGPTKSNGLTKPDLAAPGRSVVSTRVAGSAIDTAYPEARVGDKHFVGSGTSFASGVVSGAAALVLSANPELTPNQIKARLVDSARTGPVTDPQRVGAGWLNAEAATFSTSTRSANEGLAWSDGSGKLQASRGSLKIEIETGTILDPILGPLPLLTTVEGDLTAQNLLFDYESFRGEWTASSWWASSWWASSWWASSWWASSWWASSWWASSWWSGGWS